MYQICLDDVGGSVSVRHAAALSSSLRPGESLVLEKIDKKNSFTQTDWLLLSILNLLSEEPIDPFMEEEQMGNTFTQADYERKLSLPRKEAS